jgi:hypothetical protein
VRSLPFDTTVKAFESEPGTVRDVLALAKEFGVGSGRFAYGNVFAIVAIVVCTLVFTQLGASFFDYAWPEFPFSLKDHASQARRCMFGIPLILLAIYILREEIVGIANIGGHSDFPHIFWTFFFLALATYDVIELLFGWGSGNNWASDYVTAYFAAWAIRTIISGPVYRRHILARRDVGFHKRRAKRSFEAKQRIWLAG